jgi:polysaccharide export outer membrane protein
VLALLLAVPARAADAPLPDSTTMDWSRVPEYRIVPGDKLSLNMGPRQDGTQDFIREQLVRPDGRITVYPVGDVVAAGLTPMELQKSIIALLSADLRAPRVTVEIVAMAGNQVHVLGQVTTPGSFTAGPFMTVSQAVAAAGGLKDDAARNDILLIHREGARTVRVAKVHVGRFLRGLEFVDPQVSRYDIVYVPRTSVGNLNVFLNQFFSGLYLVSSTSLTGWELFNLDRVFLARAIRQ